MPAIEVSDVSEAIHDPKSRPASNRLVQRLVDARAAAEAAAALHAERERLVGKEPCLAAATAAADSILSALPSERWLLPDDPAALERIRTAVATNEFVSLIPDWIRDLRKIAALWPDCGACTVATAFELWSCTFRQLSADESAAWAIDELVEVMPSLLASRALVLSVANGTAAETGGAVHPLRSDLSFLFAARTAASMGARCAELVFGLRQHAVWDEEGCSGCFSADEVDALEGLIPGMASGARMSADVIEADGSHPAKRGPCARFDGVDTFMALRHKLDGCLTGTRAARIRAAAVIARPNAASQSPAGVMNR